MSRSQCNKLNAEDNILQLQFVISQDPVGNHILKDPKTCCVIAQIPQNSQRLWSLSALRHFCSLSSTHASLSARSIARPGLLYRTFYKRARSAGARNWMPNCRKTWRGIGPLHKLHLLVLTRKQGCEFWLTGFYPYLSSLPNVTTHNVFGPMESQFCSL